VTFILVHYVYNHLYSHCVISKMLYFKNTTTALLIYVFYYSWTFHVNNVAGIGLPISKDHIVYGIG
jgi:hypothetical protein